MVMGPEPMMRIFLRSLLGGIAYPGDKLSTEGFRGQGGLAKVCALAREYAHKVANPRERGSVY
jgi:hypothetical protein